MNDKDSPLAGRVAIVTGAARNIGRAIALRLAADGATVVVNAVQDSPAADAVAHEISEAGGQAMAHVADVTDEEAVQKMVSMVVTAFGKVDIMVSNASVRGQVPVAEMTLEEWHRVLAVPLDGAFLLSKSCIPHMRKNNWGRVVTLGGISAYIGTKSRAHLLAAKAGLVGFTRGLAAEVAEFGITCNVVSPGHIETDRPASAGDRPPLSVQPPINRFGSVDEVASMVRYLSLPEASYITGQTMHINGGLYMGV